MSVVDDNYTNEYIFAVPTALAQYKPKYIHTVRIYIFIKIHFEQVSNTKLQLYIAYIKTKKSNQLLGKVEIYY